MIKLPPQQTKTSASRTDLRQSERGFTTLGVLVLFVILMVMAGILSTTATQTAKAERRDDDRQNEYWKAFARAETLEAVLTHDLPQAYDQDVQAARQIAGLRPLPAFDDPTTREEDSKPLYRNGQQVYETWQATSLLGTVSGYASSKMGPVREHAYTLGVPPDSALVAEVIENTRRVQTGSNNVGRSEAYILKYQIHASFGLGGRIQPSGTIQLGNTGAGCTSTISATANPTVIRRGQSSTLHITYSATDRIDIKAGDTPYQTLVVDYQEQPQSIDVQVSPNDTTDYTTTSLTGNCQATAAPVTVTVQYNDAAFVSQSIPPSVEAGSTTPVSVTMRNTGTTTWVPGTYFLDTNIGTWGTWSIPVPRNIAPGEVSTFNFNIVAPAACPDTGQFQWQMTEKHSFGRGYSSNPFGEITPLANINIKCPPPRYEGNFDSLDCTQMYGWVYNSSLPDDAITVKIYLDGNYYTQVTADQYRADLQAAGKGNGQHGFQIPTPITLQNGFPHTVNITTDDGAYTLQSSPRNITCGTRYEGSLEQSDCSQISGWGWDRNQPGTATSISIFSDGALLQNVTANLFRADLLASGIGDGQHGFQMPTPASLRDGRNHSITATFAGTNTLLGGSPRVINCPPPADPCPAVSLTANGAKSLIVNEGDSFTLDYTSSGAKTLSMDNGIGAVAVPAGSKTFSFLTQGTYTITITAVNSDGSCTRQDSVTIQVRRPADPCPTVSLTVNGAKSVTVSQNEVFTLSYSSSSSAELLLDNGIGAVTPPSGVKQWSFSTTGTYTITLTGYSAGRACSAQDSVTVVVTPPLPSLAVSLTVNGAKAASIKTNEAATLGYSSTAAAELFIDNGIGAVTVPSGTRSIQFSTPGTYRVTLTGYTAGRTNTAQDYVDITVSARPAPTVSLTANGVKSITVLENDPFTLAWTTTNAAEGSMDNGIGAVDIPSGTRIARLATRGQYRITITVYNSDRSASAQDYVDITVNPIPPPSCPTVTLSISNSPTPGRIRLNYTSVNAASLSIDPGVGSVPVPSGMIEINAPSVATTYTITGTPTDARCAAAQASASYAPLPTPTCPSCADQLSGDINSIYYHYTWILTKTVNLNWGGIPFQATINETVVENTGLGFPALIENYQTCYEINLSSSAPAGLQLEYIKIPTGFYGIGSNDPAIVDAWPTLTNSLITFPNTQSGLGLFRTSQTFNNNNGMFTTPESVFALRGRANGTEYVENILLDYRNAPYGVVDPLLNGEIWYSAPGTGNIGVLQNRIVNGVMVSP